MKAQPQLTINQRNLRWRVRRILTAGLLLIIHLQQPQLVVDAIRDLLLDIAL